MVKKIVVKIKKKSKNIFNGVVYIYLIFNNIIVVIIDVDGKVVSWKFGGIFGFKGIKKGILFVV